MSYRETPAPTPTLCDVTTASELHLLNGSEAEFAIPCRYIVTDDAGVETVEPIHLRAEGYEDPSVAFLEPPTGLTWNAWIDGDDDSIVRLVISARCPDALTENLQVPFSVPISRIVANVGPVNDIVMRGVIDVIAAPLVDGTSPRYNPNGRSTLVYVYMRSSVEPAPPQVPSTYGMNTGELTGLELTGWSTRIPIGTATLWVCVATAFSMSAYDTIQPEDWGEPIQFGSNGINQATIFLFKRTELPTPLPELDMGILTYTFETGRLTGEMGSWATTLNPTGGPYRWMTTAQALAVGDSDTISPDQWSPIALLAQDGGPGLPGESGPPGDPGTPGDSVQIQYSSVSAMGPWHDPPWNFNDAWMRTRIGNDPVVWSAGKLFVGQAGAPGATGPQGPTGPQAPILYTWIKYGSSDQGADLRDDPTGMTYMGIAYNQLSATESTNPADYTWAEITGTTGPQGPPGPTTYTWIKYATSILGAGISDDPTGRSYIGIAYNKLVSLESTNPADYTWSLFQGDEGVQGPAGPAGPTDTRYTWIKYAMDANGTGMTNDPTGMTHIGLAYNKTTAVESNIPFDYAWSAIVGPTGPAGPADSRYTWIKYATTPTTGMSDDPTGKDYIGLAFNKTTPVESTNYSDYTWALFRGNQGIPGNNGTNGRYVAVAYRSFAANDAARLVAPTGNGPIPTGWYGVPYDGGAGTTLYVSRAICNFDNTLVGTWSVPQQYLIRADYVKADIEMSSPLITGGTINGTTITGVSITGTTSITGAAIVGGSFMTHATGGGRLKLIGGGATYGGQLVWLNSAGSTRAYIRTYADDANTGTLEINGYDALSLFSPVGAYIPNGWATDDDTYRCSYGNELWHPYVYCHSSANSGYAPKLRLYTEGYNSTEFVDLWVDKGGTGGDLRLLCRATDSSGSQDTEVLKSFTV